MKGQVGWGLMFVFLIILALFILAAALPIILRAIGMPEWGNLIEKLQNLQKYKNEGVTISLPTYVSSVNFFHGENGECKNVLCKSLCSDKSGKPIKGDTFITINIDAESKPTTLSVLWKVATFRIDEAKAAAVHMAVSEMCIPKDYASSFETPGYIKNGVLVLEGDSNNVKQYCIKTQEDTNGLKIFVVKEDKC